MRSLRSRSSSLLIVCTTGWIIGALDPIAARAQSTVNGEAFGATASSLLVNVTEFPDVVLAPEGGSASAAVAGLTAMGLLTTGTIAVDTNGTTGPSNADAESTATVEQVNLILENLISADVVTAQSTSTCDGTTASSSAAGSGIADLVVAGVPILRRRRQERRGHPRAGPDADVLPRADDERDATAAEALAERAVHDPSVRVGRARCLRTS